MLNSTSLKGIKDNPWLWFLGLLLGAFLAGFGAYPALLSILGLAYVSKDKLVQLEEDAKALPRVKDQLTLANIAVQNGQFGHAGPVTLRGSGTGTTNIVAVSAVAYDRIVQVRAKAAATASVSGWLQLLVLGTNAKCNSGEFYRNPGASELLTAEVNCQDPLPAGESRQYSAIAENKLASARRVDIEVQFVQR